MVQADERRSCSWSSTASTSRPRNWFGTIRPPGWCGWVFHTRARVDVIDSDITALTAAADKVIKVGGSEPFLVNVEFQSSHETDLVETLWFRQAALYHRHGCRC